MSEHYAEHKCPCLSCRQDRVRDWVGKLIEWGIPAESIEMEINKFGGRVIIYSCNQELEGHANHKQKWCSQFNERTFRFATTWWLAHHQETLKEERTKL